MGDFSGFGIGKPKGSNRLEALPYQPEYKVSWGDPRETRKAIRGGRLDGFKASAYAAVQWYAKKQQFLTTDHVWQYLEQFASTKTPEPRALGAVMRRAQSEYLIAPTNEYAHSHRRANHGRMIRIWKSLVFDGQHAS